MMYPGRMRTALSYHKYRQDLFFFLFLFFLFSLHIIGIYFLPARLQNLFTGNFTYHLPNFTQYGCIGNLTLRVESRNETSRNQVIYAFLFLPQVGGINAGRNDGMV